MLRGMRKLSVLFALATTFASGPLMSQEPAKTSPETSTVFFYRLREAYAALLKPSVFADGKQLGRMRNGRYFSVTLPAGSHTITSTLPGSGSVIDMKPGAVYYVRLEMSRPAMFHNSRGQVTEVPEGQGKFEVSKLQSAEPEDSKPEAGN